MKQRKPFLLRLDPTLYQELEAWAEQDLRSVNGQIEFLLKQAVIKRKGKLPEPKPPPAADQRPLAPGESPSG